MTTTGEDSMPARGSAPEAWDEVRALAELRPVPPLTRRPVARPQRPAGESAALQPLRAWPVYDPYSARRRPVPEWLVNYVTRLVVIDGLAALVAVLLTVAFSSASPDLPLIAGAGVVGWPLLLASCGGYSERRLGTGTDEYRRVALAGIVALAGLGFAASAGADLRLSVLLAAPAAAVLTMIGRALQRGLLHRARRRGQMTKRVVIVGREVAVVDLVRRLSRDAASGLQVVGACVPSKDSFGLVQQGIPLLGDLTEVMRVLDEARADAVLVASASETAADYLRELAWRLEGTRIELLVAPGIIEVAAGRMQLRPTTSVPLVQILEPEFRGRRRLIKALTDRGLAAVLLLLTSPLFIGLAIAVRCTSAGPAFYRHSRIGKRGEEFGVLKFRSMAVDSGSDEALMAHNEGNAVQFKMRRDPRVTRVGAVLRKYSLDELPQLINVLKGEMSLVGPRPHVTREVEQYGADMHRRLLVKPGITGLWQVSGRSDLDWDQSVELDVRYVENWSLGLDLTILWRTVRAVVRSAGAY
jgi:exopolysaccharide biosynthesis polyprenyl glycosylphosphotransferase